MSYEYNKTTGLAQITMPKGTVIQYKTKNGKIKTQLQWNQGFSQKWNGQFSGAQRYLDSEVLRLSSKYVPLRSSMLQKSGILGTEIGKGEVCWIALYARKQYYKTADSRSYDPKRGGHWFLRMWADHGRTIIAGTKKRAGGK